LILPARCITKYGTVRATGGLHMTTTYPNERVDSVLTQDATTTFGADVASYVLAAVSVPLVLHFSLLPTVFAGLAVHVLTVKLAKRLPRQAGGLAHNFALAAIVFCVGLGLFGAGFGLWSFFHGGRGMAALLTAIAETLENLRRTLPPYIADALPVTMEDLREQIADLLREHSHKISAAGMAAGVVGLKTFVHIVFGMVIGGMTALHHFDVIERSSSLVAALYARTGRLAEAFDKVVFAQVKISALNTAFTAAYLVVVLPFFGIHLPLLKVLLPLTFVAGLLPVIGNLISNAAIVLISLGVSPVAALASLVFLVLIHKLEYFFNARIVGSQVHASAWELLCAMVGMEAVFGVGGLIAAPIAYAWLKAELKARELI
jgi:predicted PurR-regulated permease PerM